MSNKNIAVLPFLNLSSQEELEYFSDGITEEVINALSKIGELNVTSRTSAFTFKSSQQKLREIGKQLNASLQNDGYI